MDSVELLELENINIAEACRACFETCKHYKFLFDEAESIENRTLGDVFFDVVKIEMSTNSETAPTRICLACSYDLVNAYNFIQKSKKNNERLIQLSKHPNIKKADCLTEFEIDIPHDQNISDAFQIKIEKETVHDYNYSMLLEHNNSSINSFGSDGSDYEPLAKKQVKIPKLQCPYCYRIFKNQNLHESHMRTHTEGDVKKKEESEDGSKLECYECDFNCHSDLEMEKHQKSEHTTRMDSKSFYGNDKHVNRRPGDGFRSDLSSDSDDEYDFPCRSSVAIPETESDFSDDETYPIKTSKTTSTSIKPAKIDWVTKHLDPFDENNFKFTGITKLPECIEKLESPADFFLFLFSNHVIETIVEQSNLKAVQDNINKPANISKEEMEQFIGAVIFMSIVKLPATRQYWNKTIGQPHIYQTMTCNRFETIQKNLHFNDNNNFIPYGNLGYDKLFKVRPLLDGIRQQLLLVPKEEFLAVDEQIISTKARHDLNNPAQSHKCGYKNQVLSGVSGFSYDFDIFAGDQSHTRPEVAPDLGVSGSAVTRLTETVPKHLNHKIFLNSRFNSPELQVHLTKIGLLPLGPVRLNRIPNVEMPSEKELKIRGRGFYIEKVATIDGVQLSAVTWFDNQPFHMLSTYVGSEPAAIKQRYCRKEKQYKNINCPQAVRVYNQHMGGFDVLDSILGVHRIHLRSKKWYKRIFFHVVDMCVVNALILWRRKNPEKYMSLFDFKQVVAEHLCKTGKAAGKIDRIKSSTAGESNDGMLLKCESHANHGSPASFNPATSSQPKTAKAKRARNQDFPLNSVRTDNVDHMPEWQKKRQKCQVCIQKTYTKCRKCNVFLCYNDKRNCLTKFHE